MLCAKVTNRSMRPSCSRFTYFRIWFSLSHSLDQISNKIWQQLQKWWNCRKSDFTVSKALTAPFFFFYNIDDYHFDRKLQGINQIRNKLRAQFSQFDARHSLGPTVAAPRNDVNCTKSNYRQFESEIDIEIHVLARNWTLTFRIFPLCIQLCTHIRHYRSSAFNAYEFRTTSHKQAKSQTKNEKREKKKKNLFPF